MLPSYFSLRFTIYSPEKKTLSAFHNGSLTSSDRSTVELLFKYVYTSLSQLLKIFRVSSLFSVRD